MAKTERESNSQYSEWRLRHHTYEVKEEKAKVSRCSRAGLVFSVSCVDRLLRKGQFAERIGAGAPVYMAAVAQYLTYEIIDVTGKVTKHSKNHQISQQHLQLAIQSNKDLKKVLEVANISQGWVPPQSDPLPVPFKKSDQCFPKGRTIRAPVIVK
ncbi:histone H2A-beta, sperm [Alligator mississippiensis]|uniref:histone H2A-beta, sperm n=1 Tax=Alligator mississippiensis TaxID=8496 RepID=UPI0006EC4C02|nr:histone H2A-beta, sperm [Alligator mississippiensis]